MYWPLWAPVRDRREVAILCAACLMTRRDVLAQVGGLDENLFLFNEERDWCQVVRARGYSLELLGEPVVHVGGGSRRPGPMVSLEERRGYLYVIEKHRWRIAPLVRLAMTLQAVILGALDPRPQWRAMWRQQRELLRGEVRRSPFPVSGRGLPVGAPIQRLELPPAARAP
jgi:GT2 family glycosyltransferase